MQQIYPHKIGDNYRYPNNSTKYKLIRVEGFKYFFDNGHWCTDCVFADLIHIKSNTQVYKLAVQLELF